MCRKGEEKVQLAEQINCNPFCSVFVMYYWMQSKNCGSLFLWSCVASWPISEFSFAAARQQWPSSSSSKTAFIQHSQRGCLCGHKKERCDWGELVPGHIYGRISVPSWQWKITGLLQMRQEFLAWGTAVWGVLWKIPGLWMHSAETNADLWHRMRLVCISNAYPEAAGLPRAMYGLYRISPTCLWKGSSLCGCVKIKCTEKCCVIKLAQQTQLDALGWKLISTFKDSNMAP